MKKHKQEIRDKLRRKRAQAFDCDQSEGGRASFALALMADDLIASGSFEKVAGYIPMGSEIDPRPLMMGFLVQGAQLFLPEVVERDAPLRFRTWKPGDMLVSGMLGTLQPPSDQLVDEPDFVIVPLLGVDGQGVRLGQGGGFYDRTLPLLRGKGAKAFGVAYDTQIVDELPREAHDQLLDGLITPSGCKVWNEERQGFYLAQQ